MRFMVIVHPADLGDYEAGKMPKKEELAPMGKFNEELTKAGVMLSCDGLLASYKGARVHFTGDGKATASDGPFAETNDLVGGYWIWQVESKAEAIEWAKRAPMKEGDMLEIRQIAEMSDFEQSDAEDQKVFAKVGKR